MENKIINGIQYVLSDASSVVEMYNNFFFFAKNSGIHDSILLAKTSLNEWDENLKKHHLRLI